MLNLSTVVIYFEGISKVKTPAVKAFKATYQGRYTLRDCDGDAMSMTAMETVTDLLLEIMEVGPVLTSFAILLSPLGQTYSCKVLC